jgi:hypothetical protein
MGVLLYIYLHLFFHQILVAGTVRDLEVSNKLSVQQSPRVSRGAHSNHYIHYYRYQTVRCVMEKINQKREYLLIEEAGCHLK